MDDGGRVFPHGGDAAAAIPSRPCQSALARLGASLRMPERFVRMKSPVRFNSRLGRRIQNLAGIVLLRAMADLPGAKARCRRAPRPLRREKAGSFSAWANRLTRKVSPKPRSSLIVWSGCHAPGLRRQGAGEPVRRRARRAFVECAAHAAGFPPLPRARTSALLPA